MREKCECECECNEGKDRNDADGSKQQQADHDVDVDVDVDSNGISENDWLITEDPFNEVNDDQDTHPTTTRRKRKKFQTLRYVAPFIGEVVSIKHPS